LTGDVSDIYFSISNLQTLSTNTDRINEVLVSVANAKDVNAVAKAIKTALPGATVLTSASLADQVTAVFRTRANSPTTSVGHWLWWSCWPRFSSPVC